MKNYFKADSGVIIPFENVTVVFKDSLSYGLRGENKRDKEIQVVRVVIDSHLHYDFPIEQYDEYMEWIENRNVTKSEDKKKWMPTIEQVEQIVRFVDVPCEKCRYCYKKTKETDTGMDKYGCSNDRCEFTMWCDDYVDLIEEMGDKNGKRI